MVGANGSELPVVACLLRVADAVAGPLDHSIAVDRDCRLHSKGTQIGSDRNAGLSTLFSLGSVRLCFKPMDRNLELNTSWVRPNKDD